MNSPRMASNMIPSPAPKKPPYTAPTNTDPTSRGW